MLERTPTLLSLSALVLLAGAPVAHAKPDVARARAEAAIKTMANGGDITVRWRPGQVRPSVIRGLAQATTGATVQARALGFISAHPDIFLPANQLRPVQTREAGGLTVVRLRQVAPGTQIEVDGGEVTVALDAQGKVRAVHAELIPLAGPIPTAKLDAGAAVAMVLGRLVGKEGPVAVPVELAGLRPALMV